MKTAIESILTQSIADFEVLVVDGSSVDDTLKLAGMYNDDRIKIDSEVDKGIYDAMNKAIDKANGKWLFFMGSDDSFYDPYVLENILNEDIAPNTNVIYGNVKIKGNTSWSTDGTIYDGKFDLERLLNKNICHQAIFYNTAFIRSSIGYFNLNYRLCSDWDFNLRCWARTNFHYVDLIVTNFFAGGESTTKNTDELFTKEFTPNVLLYFKVSPFDKLVNNRQYQQFYQVLSLQKQRSPLRYWVNRIQKGIF